MAKSKSIIALEVLISDVLIVWAAGANPLDPTEAVSLGPMSLARARR